MKTGIPLIAVSVLAGTIVGGGIVLGAQTMAESSPDHFVTVETQGPTATIEASNCQGETCDVTVEVTEWNAIDVLVVERTDSSETVLLSKDRPTVTFEGVSQQYATENGGQGAILTYLPLLDREGTGHEGREYHRIPNLKEETKTIQPVAIGTYCPSKTDIVVDGEWKESDYTC